jgi:23S rRNA pseudouridine1911/1915/1917 synthase
MLLTGDEELGKRLQRAVQNGQYHKKYVALLMGRLSGRVAVALPLGLRPASPVRLRRAPLQDGTGQPALTFFVPLVSNDQATLVEVLPASGRLHQIRAHARALGHPVFGDKIYGPDETLFLEFLEQGWTERQQDWLGLKRQALHCSSVEFTMDLIANKRHFSAPLASDIREFCEKSLGLRLPAYFALE